ncbi:bifunctional [glutamate--ammonia ligase]-adenylyl-L-tyrosine phosphorylase/[glutamate--ammonia-ligase] adenylyltransferase [Aliiglaciecola sp. LCG003]|uniref:bifunctional [glutamate--ammonia ligase]-adenylyl-L-tyrosine phosphorylase/[glutamate--ammonia-ligase] adenylyltransferase n=1 Tax=Aliiglaciecola sp. LCG003 TaxID=3053655 RepID=UPI00257446A6|nr:bifunctional [glutamate--ammonia ligase]-adenylyl-L-tyrosine phosphorylase/[glutamate--ammonia-ligase] adenylyltransferase [Aliiglaciecola sp. LCG003]WJG10431.1 bifunctional [glutamate--ammonia ligase]-adenylyl-L-tyrosine phosphorylase/[glutamate--ammonia-ligase] adenylyltransferase [Aliiglaciecola sp. LCG003]
MTNAVSQLNAKTEFYWQRLIEKCPQWNNESSQSQSLKTVLGLSDFIAERLLSDPKLIDPLLTIAETQVNPDDYAQLLNTQITPLSSQDELMANLRRFRNLHMMALAYKDLLNLQTIEQSLLHTSNLADALICGAYNWLYKHLCERYGQPMGEFGPQPLLILGMGKLGGEELNFSSDIDLIFCYPANGEISGQRKPIEHQQFFTKLAQRLINVLHETTQDGRVFRVDMRLRPFGESGPLVMHMAAFEDYYQEQGREWERYAMVKARVLNDKSAYSDELKAILKPFVYRRYIDYGAVDSLREMKSLITQEVRRRGLTNNIKLGAGGIREVEFIAQSFQLIKGGREPRLQKTSLLKSMQTLAELELLPEDDKNTLITSYLFLRKVEHCLQQFDDQQTQVLPEDELDQQRLCAVMGYADYAQFNTQLAEHTQTINQHFQLLIGGSADSEDDNESLDNSDFQDAWLLPFTAEEIQPLLSKHVAEQEAIEIAELIISFKQFMNKKRPSAKAENAVNLLIPQVLHHISQSYAQHQPENPTSPALSFARVLAVLQAVLLRTTYLQLLLENRGALKQLIRLCHASPWIAEQIARYPILLDELLNPVHLYHPTDLHEYAPELRQALLRVEPDDLELQMETLRQFKQIQQLKIAAADVTGALPVMQVSDHLTYLAESIISEVVNMAWQQMKQKYGIPQGTSDQDKKFAVVAYGKLGGIELGYGSDLDLVLLHDCPSSSMTDGNKSVESGQFYTKLAQRIMHLFMTKTPSGQLYELDMRLRPSGNAGLLVCPIQAFERYQLDQAWTWEHQALVRTRLVYATVELINKFDEIRHTVLSKNRVEADLKQQVEDMRTKMRSHLNKGNQQWLDVKQDTGTITDIEFLVQYWVLAYTFEFNQLSRWSDNVRILEDLEMAGVIDNLTLTQLKAAYLDYRNSAHRQALLGKDNLISRDQFSDHQQNVSTIWNQTFLPNQ